MSSPSSAADPTRPQPSLPESPQESSPVASLLFSASEQPAPWESPSDSPSPRLSESHDEDLESPELDAATPSAPRSSRASRRKVRELLPMTKAAVETAGGAAHALLTVDGTVERAEGLFLPDEDDVTAIAEPLASLASRRMPEGAENPDVTDLIQLAFGLVTYAIKQVQLRAAILRDRIVSGDVEDDPDAQEVPA